MRRTLSATSLLLAGALALPGCGSAAPSPPSRPPCADTEIAAPCEGAELIGTPAWEWAPDGWLQGEPCTVASLQGRVILVRFFTDGCPYCAASMPALEQLHRKYADQGLVVVGLHHPKPAGSAVDRAALERLLEKWGVTFPVALDSSWSTLREWWLDADTRRFTSASFLIDATGRYRFIHPGPELHPEGTACTSAFDDCVEQFDALEAAVGVLLAETP